MTTRELLN